MTTRAPAVLTISKRNRKVQIYVVVSSWSLQRAPILLLGRIRFDFDRSSSWWQNLGNSTQNNMLNLLLLCENHGFPSSKCPFRLWYVCRLHLIHFDKETHWQTCRACTKEILTLFLRDLLCNRPLSHFLGRTSKKKPPCTSLTMSSNKYPPSLLKRPKRRTNTSILPKSHLNLYFSSHPLAR